MTQDAKKILVVEDESALREALMDKLGGLGHIVLGASNGAEGLSVALTQQPALIVLDVVMPQMNGIEMLRGLRKDAWGKTAAVIALTNLDDPETVAELVENGVFEYFVKADWPLEKIVEKLQESL